MSSEARTPTVYRARSGWGNRIKWFSETRISGHLTPLPKVGDIFQCPMESGREGQYVITKMDPCWNPSDMFFADVEWKGYADEDPE